jgi:lysophospholipase L1-like esterase
MTAKSMDDLTKVHFGGRWWRNEDDAMEHSWGIGTFIVRFRGSSKLVMRMKSAYSGVYYTCQIDGGREVKLLHDNSVEYFEVASGLVSTEEHTVRCGRNNEASWGSTIIYDLNLDTGGEILQADDPNADNTMLRFEAIGDSITAGFKVTSNSAYDPLTIENQDVFQTYIRFMADAFGTSDYNVVAKTGVTMLDYAQTEVSMPLEWSCRQFWNKWQVSCPSLWDFSSWQADVVTINLGTNDFFHGNPTQQQFREGYLSLIQDVRTKYPHALIACIEPIQHSCSIENNDVKLNIIEGIVDGLEQAVNDMSDPKVIYYRTENRNNQWLDCTANTTDFVDFIHPTVRGNKKIAARLIETMREDVRRFFPEKCGGSGILCKAALQSSTTAPERLPSLSFTSTATAINIFLPVLFLVSSVVCRCRLRRGGRSRQT